MRTYRNNFGENHKGGGIGPKLLAFRRQYGSMIRANKRSRLKQWRGIEDGLARAEHALLKLALRP